MVYTLFQVHTLKFNRKDYDTLSLFYLNRGYYNELSFRVLERCYEIASARPNDSSTMRTFTDFVSGAPIVRKGNMDTIWHPTCFCYYTWMSYRFFLHTKQVYLAKRKSTQSGRAWLETSFCVIEKFCSESQSEELTSIWKTILFFKYREIVLPKLRRDTNQMTAALKNKVTVAIDELTVPLMWRIPLPLSRASATRFCRSSAQRIRRRYNKNGSSEPRLKTLDGLTSERWIQWLGLESDYHCSFSSTRNAEDVVAGEAASSDHHQKISRVTRKRPREPKSTNDILVAGQKLFGSSFEFRDLHQLRLCYEIYMADTPSVAVQAPPGYGKTELFHLPLIALASKGDVKYVSFLFVPYTVLLANCMIRLGRRGCLNVAPVRNFIEEGYDGVTDLYVGIYDDLASTNFTDRIAAWENIVECTFRTNNVKLGYLIVDEFHNFETEVYRQSQFGGITNLDFDAFEKAIFLSGTAPEAVADAALQRIGLTGLAKKSMDINELKRSEDLSRGLSSYPTRMFNLIKEKSEVPLGHVHKIRKKVESQPEEALKLLLALFESEPESKAIVVASTTNEVEELACSWRKYFRVVWIHGKLGAAEKVSRTKEFVTDGSMQVLIGTKLVTEGIDIKQLMMVIMLDNRLNIIELIQGVGRLRDGGLCYLLSRKNSWAARNRKGELPPIKEGCITEQVREFYGLESKKGKKGQHVGCCGSRTDLSADTVELIERMDRLAEKQATASMSIVALPSNFQESNSSDRYRKYCSSDEDSNTCIHGSANASTNVRTNATTTASINVRTSATTTESTNSSTSATTTASINVRTSATTTASINVRTSATTTKSINSSTNATTTESTNSNTNATTTESTNSSTNATTTESTNFNTSATTTKVPTPTLVLLPPKVPTPTLVLLPPKVPTPTLVLLPLLAPTPALMLLPLK
ncbi:EM14S01-3B_G0053630.mRNA.1.CDS.1, partial [Saccharomyces cerevisiae]